MPIARVVAGQGHRDRSNEDGVSWSNIAVGSGAGTELGTFLFSLEFRGLGTRGGSCMTCGFGIPGTHRNSRGRPAGAGQFLVEVLKEMMYLIRPHLEWARYFSVPAAYN